MTTIQKAERLTELHLGVNSKARQIEKKSVYFIQHTVMDAEGNYIPCIAVEGESGYHITDWTWGKDYALAEMCAEEKNERMGISKKEAIRVVLGTMFKK